MLTKIFINRSIFTVLNKSFNRLNKHLYKIEIEEEDTEETLEQKIDNDRIWKDNISNKDKWKMAPEDEKYLRSCILEFRDKRCFLLSSKTDEVVWWRFSQGLQHFYGQQKSKVCRAQRSIFKLSPI